MQSLPPLQTSWILSCEDAFFPCTILMSSYYSLSLTVESRVSKHLGVKTAFVWMPVKLFIVSLQAVVSEALVQTSNEESPGCYMKQNRKKSHARRKTRTRRKEISNKQWRVRMSHIELGCSILVVTWLRYVSNTQIILQGWGQQWIHRIHY